MSVFEALKSAAMWNDTKLKIKWIDAEKIKKDKDIAKEAKNIDGIVIPGGFGTRGLEGKITSAQYALQESVPYLGLCLGMQMAVIAAARNYGIKKATSIELDPKSDEKVIDVMEGQEGKQNTGGTMRLGDYPCKIAKDSRVAKMYGTTSITERHRHRCEANNKYRDEYESWGIRAVGTSPNGSLVEIIEAIDHPFFVASQFHPEFKSRPNRPHPMFDGFIKAILQNTK
jgi:CTP synthase